MFDVHTVCFLMPLNHTSQESILQLNTPSPSPLGFPLSLCLSPLLSGSLFLICLSLSLSLCVPLCSPYSIQGQRREKTLGSP